MVTLSVEHNIRDVLRQMERVYRDQIPFATSLAINNVAKQVQADERAALLRRFTVRRRQWVERNVKIIRFSNKRDIPIHAIVGIEAPGDPKRSDILGKFEKGGTKKPKGSHLAVPDEARKTKTQVVPKRLRPKSFEFTRHGSGAGLEVYRGEGRTFMIRRSDGTGGIYQRIGRQGRKKKDGTRGKGAGRRLASDIGTRKVRDMNVRTLYRFTPQAHIDSRLRFEETARGTIQAQFARTFEEAFQRAIDAGRWVNVGRHRGQTIIKASPEARRIGKADVGDIGRGRRR